MNRNYKRFKKVIERNKKKDNMLGDLCRDIDADVYFPWFDDVDTAFEYLDSLVSKQGDYLKEPVRRFKIAIKNTK